MLVFLIHGVATQNAGYGDQFKKKVKELMLEAKTSKNSVAEHTKKQKVEWIAKRLQKELGTDKAYRYTRAYQQNQTEIKPISLPIFYSSFWGHTFKSQTDQLFNWVRSDINQVTQKHKDLQNQGSDTVFFFII